MSIANCPLEDAKDVVSWTLSGSYDENRPVLVDANDPTRSLSKRGATDLICRLAGSFEPGSTVCGHLYNDILYPVLVLATLASRCEWTSTNPAYTSAELSHHFTQSETKYIITESSYLGVVDRAIISSGRDIQVIIYTDIASTKVVKNFDLFGHVKPRPKLLCDLLAKADRMTLRERLKNISSDSPATVMSTSGTTGLPKMVQRSHRSLIVETSAIQDNDARKLYQVRRLYCTPIFHAFSFPEMVINSLRLGHQSFFMRRFDETFAKKVHNFNITETMAAPAMLLRLVARSERDELEQGNLQSLRMVLCAGAPLAPKLRIDFLRLFDKNSIRVVQVWGLSEGGWFATFRYPEHDDTGSVGRLLPVYQLRVCEASRVELSDGKQAGELLVKGLQPTTTYKGNPDATKESFGDGWLRTGDIGYVKDKKVYLIDRAKDIIKVNGWTISPAELEAVLYQMPGILDAAALSYGTGTEEHAALFIIARDPTLSNTDVLQHLLSRVARFKIATCEIHLVDSLPRNPSGKILRNNLRQRLDGL